MSAPIDLDRKFVEVGESAANEIDPPEYSAFWTNKVGWDDLLALPRVVVLGEARTGKSTELQMRADRLAACGEASFLLTVEDLAKSPLTDLLGAEQLERLERWRASGGRAYFFVDSIDEARLNDLKLADALRELEVGLRQNATRAHVLLSCRASDWRHREDRRTLERILPPPSQSEIRVFSLAPLDPDQIEKFAIHKGATDAHAFRVAAEASHVEVFLERPGDLEWMVVHWERHRRFGTLTELLEEDITQKLTEQNPDRTATLELAVARRAVEALTGLSWFGSRSMFALPDGDIDPARAATCVDPTLVRSLLNKGQLEELLSLPIFDEATYGRVRLHHRSAREYLIAQWLFGLLTRGLPRPDLEAIVFRDGPAGPMVPDRALPVAAWLACHDLPLRRQLIETAPSAFLTAGDPTYLRPADQRDILAALVRQYTDRVHRFQSFDRATLRRFAACCDPTDVASHLRTTTNPELRSTLVTIVSEGRLALCVPEVLTIATSGMDDWPQSQAIHCVAELGATADVEQMLRTLVDGATSVTYWIADAIVSACYPRWLSIDRLLTLLSRVDRTDKKGNLRDALETKVLPDTLRGDRNRILAGILALLADPTSTSAGWLREPFAVMIVYQADSLDPDEMAQLEPYLGDFMRRKKLGGMQSGLDGERELRDLLLRNAALRRLAVWWDVERHRADRPGAELTRFVDLFSVNHMWVLVEEDVEWLAENARTRPDARDRLLAFDSLMNLQADEAGSIRRDQLVGKLVADDEVLRQRYEGARRPPTISPEHQAMIAQGQQWERKRVAREARIHKKNQDTLNAAIAPICEGTEVRLLGWLHGESAHAADGVAAKLADVTKQFGTEIGAAMSSGLQRMWRHVSPSLRHEPSHLDDVQEAARAGLTLYVASGFDLEHVDQPTATVLARYAVATNPLPEWLDRLVAVRREAVLAVVAECIRADFAAPAEGPPHETLIGSLPYASADVRRVSRSLVYAAVAGDEPPRSAVLSSALRTLIGTDVPLDDVAAMAPTRYERVRHERDRACAWWCAWLASDAEPAIGALEIEIAAAPDEGTKDALVVDAADHAYRFLPADFYATRWPALPSSTVSALGRLVELAFIRIREVVTKGRRSGGQSVTIHHAEMTRQRWFDTLSSSPGLATYDELVRLAEVPNLATMRDIILVRADQRLSEDLGAIDPPCVAKIVSAYRLRGLGADAYMTEMVDIVAEPSIDGVEALRNDVFIAYASEDAATAERLDALLRPEMSVFFDRRSLVPGLRWDTRIRPALRASRATVVLVTSRTTGSLYVGDEIHTALSLCRKAHARHVVIPVRLEPGIELPYGLATVEALDVDAEGGLGAVARKLIELMRARTTPSAGSTAPDLKVSEHNWWTRLVRWLTRWRRSSGSGRGPT